MIGLIGRILKLAEKYRNRIIAAAVFSFFKSAVSKMPIVFAFYLISRFIDGTITVKNCVIIGAALVLCILLECVFQNGADRLQSASGFEIFADLRKKLGVHLRKMPMGFFTEGNIGRISSILSTDMQFIEENLMMVLADLMSYLFSAVLFVVLMFFFDVRLGGLALLVTLVIYAIGEGMKKEAIRHSNERQAASQKMTEAVLDFTEGIGVIKTYNILGEKSEELANSFAENCEKSLSFEHDYAPWSTAINLAYGAGTTMMLALSWIMYNDGTLSLSYFIGILLFLFEMFSPLRAFYGQVARLTVMNSCVDRIEAIFDEEELADRGTGLITAEEDAVPGTPEIEFRDVSFSYDTREVLRNISFSMPKNTMTALVGASGSGKTTIANLLARFWDIEKGSILVKGKDIRDITLASLMDQISMVFQRVYLFQDTVYNNIAMGRTGATEEEVIDAAKKARCYDFIQALPDGFQTVIGEGGASLSGGEQQRISIARCILKDAPIVILDEATASVDADNESHIQAAISELVKGKTLLVIAHRLHTIAEAEQILVVDNGRIVESGTHDTLLSAEGVYHAMVTKRAVSSLFKNK